MLQEATPTQVLLGKWHQRKESLEKQIESLKQEVLTLEALISELSDAMDKETHRDYLIPRGNAIWDYSVPHISTVKTDPYPAKLISAVWDSPTAFGNTQI